MLPCIGTNFKRWTWEGDVSDDVDIGKKTVEKSFLKINNDLGFIKVSFFLTKVKL